MGMLVVFIFLTLLVFLMQLLSAFVQRFFPEKPEEAIKPKVQGEAEVAAAIAAVKAFTKFNRGQV